MPSGSITIVSWPACTSKGTRFRNPYAEPNSPGISTTGSPSPAITTCSDSAGLSGTLKLRDVSATSASTSSGTTARSSGYRALNLSLFLGSGGTSWRADPQHHAPTLPAQGGDD